MLAEVSTIRFLYFVVKISQVDMVIFIDYDPQTSVLCQLINYDKNNRYVFK